MSFVLSIIKQAIRGKTGFDSLISATITFDVKTEKTVLKCEGVKSGEIKNHEGALVADGDANDLRKLFLTQAGSIPGEVTFVKMDFDYVNMKSKCEAYYIHQTTGKKLIKEFTA